ncbi:MAG: FAD-dependent oxidoreductase [Ignavibacteriae bacterium]|nr:FAD-dependent oxidoreductase [Ignavibacteriota bacterium]
MLEEKITTDVLVVGAGIAGLTAATLLHERGLAVLIADKARGVGGRMSTRRLGGAIFDHGAQVLSATGSEFSTALRAWSRLGLLDEWFTDTREDVTCWRGVPAMTAVPKHLAEHLDLLLETKVVALHNAAGGWSAETADGRSLHAKAVLLTTPVPQALELLAAGTCDVSAADRAALDAVRYECCIAVMAVLRDVSRIPAPGFLVPDRCPVSWIADNQQKGISDVPGITVHATPEFSRDCWGEDRREIGRALLEHCAPWIGSESEEFQVHGWLYSKPTHFSDGAFRVLHTSPPLLIAGDAFGGPHVEGAAFSGRSAAGALVPLLHTH